MRQPSAAQACLPGSSRLAAAWPLSVLPACSHASTAAALPTCMLTGCPAPQLSCTPWPAGATARACGTSCCRAGMGGRTMSVCWRCRSRRAGTAGRAARQSRRAASSMPRLCSSSGSQVVRGSQQRQQQLRNRRWHYPAALRGWPRRQRLHQIRLRRDQPACRWQESVSAAGVGLPRQRCSPPTASAAS